jgi:hypothetical protein
MLVFMIIGSLVVVIMNRRITARDARDRARSGGA